MRDPVDRSWVPVWNRLLMGGRVPHRDNKSGDWQRLYTALPGDGDVSCSVYDNKESRVLWISYNHEENIIHRLLLIKTLLQNEIVVPLI